MTLLETTQFYEQPWVLVIASVIAVLFVTLGPLRGILRKRLDKKYHKVFDVAVQYAEEWAETMLRESVRKPTGVKKLAQAAKYAANALGTSDPETLLRGVEGALARSKLDDDLMDAITTMFKS